MSITVQLTPSSSPNKDISNKNNDQKYRLPDEVVTHEQKERGIIDDNKEGTSSGSLSIPVPALKRRTTGGLADTTTTTLTTTFSSSTTTTPSSSPLPLSSSFIPFSDALVPPPSFTLLARQQTIDRGHPGGSHHNHDDEPPADNDELPPLGTSGGPPPPTFPLVFTRQQTVGGDESRIEEKEEPPADNDDLPPVYPIPSSSGGLLFVRQQTVTGEDNQHREETEEEPPADSDELPPVYPPPPGAGGGGPLLFVRQQTVDNPRERNEEDKTSEGNNPPVFGLGGLLFVRQQTVTGENPREDTDDEPSADSDELPPVYPPPPGAGGGGPLLFVRQQTVDHPRTIEEEEITSADNNDALPPAFPDVPSGGGPLLFVRQQTVDHSETTHGGDVSGPTAAELAAAESDDLPPPNNSSGGAGLSAPGAFSPLFERQRTLETPREDDESDDKSLATPSSTAGGTPHSIPSSHLSREDLTPLSRAVFRRHQTNDSTNSDDENHLRDLPFRSPLSASSTLSNQSQSSQHRYLTTSLVGSIPSPSPSTTVPPHSPLFNRVPTDTDPHGTEDTKKDLPIVASPSTVRIKSSPILSPSKQPPLTPSKLHSAGFHDVPFIDPIFNRSPTETNPHG